MSPAARPSAPERERGFGAHAGVVFTPPKLATAMAERVPRTANAILDPACGDGNLLVAANALGWNATQLHGLEREPQFVQRARERLPKSRGIRGCDALAQECEWPAGAWILANPPWLSFSGRHAGRDRSQRERASNGWPGTAMTSRP